MYALHTLFPCPRVALVFRWPSEALIRKSYPALMIPHLREPSSFLADV